ncbi:MAG: 2-phospho-L-lactate guanylyltransferase [Chloroflexi bacterium]|nr:2-phospho-L-lactate guanylyltransferase [Chloroflexota bacterium]
MSVWTIIPVKPLNRAKSRLTEALSPDQRAQLAEALFRHVLATVKQVTQVAGVLVISRDTKALAIAREYGAQTVQESGAPELNNALMRATQVVAAWRTGALLILPADLPLVTPGDIRAMIQHGREDRTVVISTDRNADGTNAMLIRPPGLIPYAYGAGSYGRHRALAAQVGAQVIDYESETLMLDIDVPEDLALYRSLYDGSDPLLYDLAAPDQANG